MDDRPRCCVAAGTVINIDATDRHGAMTDPTIRRWKARGSDRLLCGVMNTATESIVTVSGVGLTTADVVSVARDNWSVSLGAAARLDMQRSADLIEGFIASDSPVYGVTTGFGALANTAIASARTAELQVALVRSHAAGMGDEVEREVVRAMLLLRARSLAMARSGARPELVDLQLAMLNAGLTPVVREHGSLGASGDLAPLSHCALALS